MKCTRTYVRTCIRSWKWKCQHFEEREQAPAALIFVVVLYFRRKAIEATESASVIFEVSFCFTSSFISSWHFQGLNPSNLFFSLFSLSLSLFSIPFFAKHKKIESRVRLFFFLSHSWAGPGVTIRYWCCILQDHAPKPNRIAKFPPVHTRAMEEKDRDLLPAVVRCIVYICVFYAIHFSFSLSCIYLRPLRRHSQPASSHWNIFLLLPPLSHPHTCLQRLNDNLNRVCSCVRGGLTQKCAPSSGYSRDVFFLSFYLSLTFVQPCLRLTKRRKSNNLYTAISCVCI